MHGRRACTPTGPGDPPIPDRRRGSGEATTRELALPYWLTSTEEAANTSFLRMLRRLPRLLREAWLLAWQASRRTTAAVVRCSSPRVWPGRSG